MSGPQSNILAVGVAGRSAGIIVLALASRGGRVRALVRIEKQGELARHLCQSGS